MYSIISEKPGEPTEERAAPFFSGWARDGSIIRFRRLLAKNHLKPFIYDSLNFFARDNGFG